ncbi:MAG: hypothetical protein A2857_01685 [Candidatus Levybacteria bacterium RIFCSPHIGHO2_01_FULL_36_15]|nr:MAG: hypothetical protein A2857_01685 [Candidatus Levybacteria bacterium RIFCSPHIGHO2_01_FULL_36_15]OGH38016.1 MAG: hypothetical protein A2905_05900 [Candidatus Levybacteria bacterium RIFCSPLOWO2_01_FULL_36_10]
MTSGEIPKPNPVQELAASASRKACLTFFEGGYWKCLAFEGSEELDRLTALGQDGIGQFKALVYPRFECLLEGSVEKEAAELTRLKKEMAEEHAAGPMDRKGPEWCSDMREMIDGVTDYHDSYRSRLDKYRKGEKVTVLLAIGPGTKNHGFMEISEQHPVPVFTFSQLPGEESQYLTFQKPQPQKA